MKTLTLLLDLLQNSSLMEMAFQRKVLYNKILYIQDQIALHLCKVLLFPNDPSYNHWLGELNGWLGDINGWTLKGSAHRKLDGKTYYELLFNHLFDGGIYELDNKLIILANKGYIIPDLSSEEKTLIYQNIETIMRNISFDISNNKFTKIQDYLNEH